MIKIFENLDINNLENEVWKVITDFPDYSVSNLGRIKSFKKWHGTDSRILKQQKRKEYFKVDLFEAKKCVSIQVHTLIYETFNNYKLKDNECIHHTNGDKENNIFENLEKMSKYEHQSFHKKGKYFSEKHKIKISEKTKGENNHNHKLTEQDVIQIKLLLKEGILTQQEIADIFGVSRGTISKIKLGKRWK